jgi:hypothetical protein
MIVLLPAPFGPNNPTISPRPTEKLTWLTSLDYDPRYSNDKLPWTSEMFIESVYRSLAPSR